ncbi:hypothetical protein VTK73DRAFT_3105 [Phialemonium thermophilum]|uniref:Uncharacterized protein n=1 Tax=Phialemonium thermophilum TaxID=223376 RepID=A0ABR3VKU2_9PEZI
MEGRRGNECRLCRYATKRIPGPFPRGDTNGMTGAPVIPTLSRPRFLTREMKHPTGYDRRRTASGLVGLSAGRVVCWSGVVCWPGTSHAGPLTTPAGGEEMTMGSTRGGEDVPRCAHRAVGDVISAAQAPQETHLGIEENQRASHGLSSTGFPHGLPPRASPQTTNR